MPIYSVRDNDTGEIEDMMMSYSSLTEYLKEHPNKQSIITKAPGLATAGTRGALTQAGDGWKEVQDRVRSGMPPKDRHLVRTK